LQHTKVELTWDEDKYDRVLLTKRKFTKEDLDKLDLDAYVASSGGEDFSSEDEGEEGKKKIREKYQVSINSFFDSKIGELT